VRRDHAACAARAVGHRGRDRELSAPADLHPLDAGVPAGDDLALAELELEGLAAVPRGVELLARGEADSDVVNGHLLALDRLVAVADDDVIDPELEGDVAVGSIDSWAFACQLLPPVVSGGRACR